MNFNEFAAYVKRNEPNIAGNLYICSKFLIGLNSNPQFRALPDPSSPARWKSHTNLTHPGKYFRPSKVKIMRPTSPK